MNTVISDVIKTMLCLDISVTVSVQSVVASLPQCGTQSQSHCLRMRRWAEAALDNCLTVTDNITSCKLI